MERVSPRGAVRRTDRNRDRDGRTFVARLRALQRGFGRDCRAAKLVRDDNRVRFLIANAASAGKVSDWIGSGVSYGDALTRLQSTPGVA